MTNRNDTPVSIGKAPTAPTPDKTAWKPWAEKITAAWQKSVEAVLETGRALIQAHDELDHGQWEAMISLELPFDSSTARRLIKIARHEVLSNRAHVHALPPSWGTLYELSKLPASTLEAKINDGTITPKLERKEVASKVAGVSVRPTNRREQDRVQSVEGDPDAAHQHVNNLETAHGQFPTVCPHCGKSLLIPAHEPRGL